MKKNIFLRLLIFLVLFNMVMFFSGCSGDITTPSATSSNSGSAAISMLAGGNLSSYNGTVCGAIARIKETGALDTTFNSGTGATNLRTITSMVKQSDGKFIIGGSFTDYNGTTRTRIARINSDGSLDTSFDPGTGVDLWIDCMAIQSDGKILIGGHFTKYNGTTRNYIARINADGSLDATFDAGTKATRYVFTIAVQSDGKILIGGFFNTTLYVGPIYNYVSRLNADGSIDNTFNPGTGANDTVLAGILQGDGKLLIGGAFTSFNGTARNRIARINANGTLDATFNPGTGAEGGDGAIYSMTMQSDGKILIGGQFTKYNGTTRNGIARINSDGSLDTSFDPGSGFSGGQVDGSYVIRTIAVQSDGRIAVGGNFTGFNGASRTGIVRIMSTGSLDTSFDPGTGAYDVYSILTL